MGMSEDIISIVALIIGVIGYITAVLATKRIKKLELQLVDIKLSATKIISLEKRVTDLNYRIASSGSE